MKNFHDKKKRRKKKETKKEKIALKYFYDKQNRKKIKKLTEIFGKISLYSFLCGIVCGITVGFVNNESLKSISSGLGYFCICASVFCLITFFILDSILDSTIDEETKKKLADMAANIDTREEGYFGKYN